jgi:choline-sulfatase
MNRTRHPNVLFLMSDEHRADIVPWENDIIRMPNLAKLAEDAVIFRNAYTPSPICIPGRQAMMTGQFPRHCGCFGWEDIAPHSMTFARRLAQYGYNTTCVGKLHHLGEDQMQGWTERPAGDIHTTHNRFAGYDSAHAIEHDPEEDGCRKWTNNQEIQRAGAVPSLREERDNLWTDVAVHYIRDYFVDSSYDLPRRNQPLLLKHSLILPHYPYFTTQEKFEYYLNRVPVYNNIPITFPDHPRLGRTQCGPDIDVTDRDARRATAAYYGMIETLDENFGRTLQTLEHVGENLDDWIIIYTTDHGDMLGEHGLWEKTQFFEGSARVPLMIRWPKGFAGGRVVDENVNLCDLFATLCDTCHVPLPETPLDSRSLRPLLENTGQPWDNETVSQLNVHPTMIKRDALKYCFYGDEGPEVLFDLAADPDENTNVIDDPQYASAVENFRKRLHEINDGK